MLCITNATHVSQKNRITFSKLLRLCNFNAYPSYLINTFTALPSEVHILANRMVGTIGNHT